MTGSELLRRWVTRVDRASFQPEKVLYEFTDAMIFGTSPEFAPLMSETARRLLSDFP